jgi:hypothetical protein
MPRLCIFLALFAPLSALAADPEIRSESFGKLPDGTLRPMALTMLAASVVANGFAMLTGAGIRATATRDTGGAANAVRAGDRH